MLIFCVGVVFASGFGITPGKINFGKVEVGKTYEKEVIVVSNSDQKIRFFSSSPNVKTEYEVYDIRTGQNKIKILLNVIDCESKKNENILVATGDTDLDAGIGVKVSYEINGECDNRITGLAVLGNEKISYNEYILYGFFGLVALIFIIRFITKKIRK